MSIRFGGASEKAFVPRQEVDVVETILNLPFGKVVERVVERRRVTCEACGRCGLKAAVSTEVVGQGVEVGTETLVSCDNIICKDPSLFSQTAREIREIGDVYADVGDDEPFESFQIEEAMREQFSSPSPK